MGGWPVAAAVATPVFLRTSCAVGIMLACSSGCGLAQPRLAEPSAGLRAYLRGDWVEAIAELDRELAEESRDEGDPRPGSNKRTELFIGLVLALAETHPAHETKVRVEFEEALESFKALMSQEDAEYMVRRMVKGGHLLHAVEVTHAARRKWADASVLADAGYWIGEEARARWAEGTLPDPVAEQILSLGTYADSFCGY